jgi:hypothetical protein
MATAGVAGAGAQSAKMRQIMQGEGRVLVADIADTNRICDVKIAGAFDWSDAPQGELERADAGTARRYCDEALMIKSVVRGYDAKRSIARKDGTLEFKSDFKSGDDVGVILVHLQNALQKLPGLAGAKRLAACRAQSSDCIALQQNRTGVAKVIALRRFMGDVLYDSAPECIPAPLGKFARSLGLTPIRRPL